MRCYFLILLAALLCGCSVLKPVPRQAITNYELTALANQSAPAKSTQLILFVTTTQAGPGYETIGIAYSQSPYQLDYFAKNRWVAPPAQLINKALVSSLQQSHYFKAVATAPYIGQHDFRLDTRLLELKQDLTTHPSQVILTVYAQMIDVKKQAIIVSKQFTIKIKAADNPEATVTAANKALSQLLDQIIAFCIHHSTNSGKK